MPKHAIGTEGAGTSDELHACRLPLRSSQTLSPVAAATIETVTKLLALWWVWHDHMIPTFIVKAQYTLPSVSAAQFADHFCVLDVCFDDEDQVHS